MKKDRLDKQIEFILEIDKLKGVMRRTILTDGSRHENSAEHSWHLAVMAILLAEYSKSENELDLFKVVKMLLIHDLVEIDAGDTYCYDEVQVKDQALREEKAADRLFHMLPVEQARSFLSLWHEYEEIKTPEARFAHALDGLQPLLHNYNTQGRVWRKHGIRREQVLSRNRHMAEGSPVLWDYVLEIVNDAVKRGMLIE
jgi:putative hydrolase of HD superfamily